MFTAIVALSSFSSCLPFAAGLISFRRHTDAGLRALFFYFFLAAVVEMIGLHLSNLHQNNIWLYNGFVVVHCLTFMNVLAHWHGHPTVRWAAVLTSVGFALFWSAEVFYIERATAINNLLFTVVAVLIVVFAGLALYEMSGRFELQLFENPRFWVASGMLVFYCVAVVVYSLFDVIVQRGGGILRATWMIHSFFNVFANVLYAVGFLCCFRPVK